LMTASTLAAETSAKPAISFFERYLTVWVAACIVIGIGLGQLLPGFFQDVANLEVAKVNIPVGVLIWVMIIPMLLKIDFGALNQVGGQAVLDGVTWVDFYSPHICAVPASRTIGQLCGWAHPACGRAVHSHGLCMESTLQR